VLRYGPGMSSPAFSATRDSEAAEPWAERLAAADRALEGSGTILKLFLAGGDEALFSDRVVAQVRALLGSLREQTDAESVPEALLGHVHALAIEAQLTERLGVEQALDPVVSPLLQRVLASSDPTASDLGRAVLAAQAEFVQTQRRGVLSSDQLSDSAAPHRANRVALLDRAIGLLEDGRAALDLSRAGVALFLSALAQRSGLSREAATLATVPSQAPRLALALIAAGAGRETIERVLLALHPADVVPERWEAIEPGEATRLLDTSRVPTR